MIYREMVQKDDKIKPEDNENGPLSQNVASVV